MTYLGRIPAAAAVRDGTRLFLDVPAGTADGTASVTLTATARVDTGRLFVGRDYGEGHETQVTATARGAWPRTPADTPSRTAAENVAAAGGVTEEAPPAPQAKATSDLAETGASLLTPGLVGLALVGLGFVVLVVRGNRRHG
jgi:hypothetical protein